MSSYFRRYVHRRWEEHRRGRGNRFWLRPSGTTGFKCSRSNANGPVRFAGRRGRTLGDLTPLGALNCASRESCSVAAPSAPRILGSWFRDDDVLRFARSVVWLVVEDVLSRRDPDLAGLREDRNGDIGSLNRELNTPRAFAHGSSIAPRAGNMPISDKGPGPGGGPRPRPCEAR